VSVTGLGGPLDGDVDDLAGEALHAGHDR